MIDRPESAEGNRRVYVYSADVSVPTARTCAGQHKYSGASDSDVRGTDACA